MSGGRWSGVTLATKVVRHSAPFIPDLLLLLNLRIPAGTDTVHACRDESAARPGPRVCRVPGLCQRRLWPAVSRISRRFSCPPFVLLDQLAEDSRRRIRAGTRSVT